MSSVGLRCSLESEFAGKRRGAMRRWFRRGTERRAQMCDCPSGLMQHGIDDRAMIVVGDERQ